MVFKAHSGNLLGYNSSNRDNIMQRLPQLTNYSLRVLPTRPTVRSYYLNPVSGSTPEPGKARHDTNPRTGTPTTRRLEYNVCNAIYPPASRSVLGDAFTEYVCKLIDCAVEWDVLVTNNLKIVGTLRDCSVMRNQLMSYPGEIPLKVYSSYIDGIFSFSRLMFCPSFLDAYRTAR